MLAYTYTKPGTFALIEKPKPVLLDARDAIVRVTLASICTSDLHIKHGSVPRAVPGVTVGHEMVGVVESVGSAVSSVRPGDRVTVNVETFCGHCFFCEHGYVNNCTDPNGGWALGCRIDGGQAAFVRVPFADQGLNKIPDSVSDRQALFVGDVLATGFWAARISEITPEDTVLIIGAGPTGLCTLLCTLLKRPKRVIVCETDPLRLQFLRTHFPQVIAVSPQDVLTCVQDGSDHGGADVVLIPEIPYDIKKVVKAVERRAAGGHGFSIVCVAEGAFDVEEARLKKKERSERRAAAGETTASARIVRQIEETSGFETRMVVPGHFIRGGAPSAYDRVLASQFGVYAADLVSRGIFGVTVAMQNNVVTHNLLSDVAGKTKFIPTDDQMIFTARRLGISFGD